MDRTSKVRSLYCGRRRLQLDRPAVMGIVNLTPDSFSGDGLVDDVGSAVRHAETLIAAGADIIDLGAESSRPGAQAVSLDQELSRLVPVLKALRDCPVPISVDTYKPEVMRVAIDGGASIINDIFAFRRPGALEVVAPADCALCFMHMQGEPLGMQAAPRYSAVFEEVTGFLDERIAAARNAGIAPDRCWIDPGFGFGKSIDHNVALFRRLNEIVQGEFPVLVGVSRKSMLGALTGRLVEDRLPASVVAAVLAARAGAAVLRVHDVAATVDGLRIWQALDGMH